MCGIAGLHRLSDASLTRIDGLADELLLGIDHRGGNATGLGWLKDDGEHRVVKASCRAGEFNAHRGVVPADVRTLLLHTRYATQGPASFMVNNHPVTNGPITLVHNGHVWNDDAIFTETGKERHGEVDSEAIPALIYARGWSKAIPALAKVEGDMAIAAYNVERPGEFLLARGNSSPVYWHATEDFLVFASTVLALTTAWGRVLGTPPSSKTIRTMEEGSALLVRDGEITHETFTVGWKYTAATTKKAWMPAVSHGGWTQASQAKVDDRFTFAPKTTALDLAEALTERGEEVIWDDDCLVQEDEEGVDCARCDDCMEWTPVDEMAMVGVGTFSNLLCLTCKTWAEDAGITR